MFVHAQEKKTINNSKTLFSQFVENNKEKNES